MPKVCRTGAGAALLADPDRAVAVARAAVEGAAEGAGRVGCRSPSSSAPASAPASPTASSSPTGWSRTRASRRSPSTRAPPRCTTAASPDYALAARLAETLHAPVILSGGMNDAQGIREAFARTGVAAVMLARGCAWQPVAVRGARARAHLRADPGRGAGRARAGCSPALPSTSGPSARARYLRKFYPWYLQRLGLGGTQRTHLQQSLQATADLAEVRRLLAGRVRGPRRCAGR